jgi:hypothetical protein
LVCDIPAGDRKIIILFYSVAAKSLKREIGGAARLTWPDHWAKSAPGIAVKSLKREIGGLEATGLAQQSILPGWLEESDLAGVILHVMGRRTACLLRTVPVALTGAAQCQAASRLNFQLLYRKCTQPSVMRNVTQRRHDLVL